MDLIFAKWIFLAAAQLAAGTDQWWPTMALEVAAPARITEQFLQEPPLSPVCAPGASGPTPCPPGPTVPGKVRQLFCLERGVYTVELRLGMLATRGAAADGRIWLAEFAPGARPQLLLEFSAERQGPTFQAGSLGIAPAAATCYRLQYDSTGPARVNPDPRITGFSIRG